MRTTTRLSHLSLALPVIGWAILFSMIWSSAFVAGKIGLRYTDLSALGTDFFPNDMHTESRQFSLTLRIPRQYEQFWQPKTYQFDRHQAVSDAHGPLRCPLPSEWSTVP